MAAVASGAQLDHLERQRGGFGFLGGPGETQIEADRRLIVDRIVRIKKELEGVKRTRALGRQARRKEMPFPWSRWWATPMPANPPCSTGSPDAKVLAQRQDLLFATLDPHGDARG